MLHVLPFILNVVQKSSKSPYLHDPEDRGMVDGMKKAIVDKYSKYFQDPSLQSLFFKILFFDPRQTVSKLVTSSGISTDIVEDLKTIMQNDTVPASTLQGDFELNADLMSEMDFEMDGNMQDTERKVFAESKLKQYRQAAIHFIQESLQDVPKEKHVDHLKHEV